MKFVNEASGFLVRILTIAVCIAALRVALHVLQAGPQ